LPDRKLSKQVTDLSERVVDLDGQIIKLNRMCDTKMKEESQSILRSIESRSPSNPGLDMRQEFLAEFKNIYRVLSEVVISGDWRPAQRYRILGFGGQEA
jgi:hypothetical protein